MGLPGQRRSLSSKRRRAAHFALKKQALQPCAKCKKMIPSHTACKYCGHYRGRVVFKTRISKIIERKAKQKKEANKEQA